MLRHRHGIAQGTVGDPDVQLPSRVQVDLIQPHPVLADDLQAGGGLHDGTGDMLIPGQQGITVCHILQNRLLVCPTAHFYGIALFGEIVFSGLRNVRRDQNFLFHSCHVLSVGCSPYYKAISVPILEKSMFLDATKFLLKLR